MSANPTDQMPVPGDAAPREPRAHLAIAATALALLALAAVAAAGVLSFVKEERTRELRAWQTRLAIVADSRSGAVAHWFATGVAGELDDLAANESLQIYMTELALAGGARAAITGEPAQAAYLRNLLVVTAERAGFAAPAGPEVAANVRRLGTAGIGLYDMMGRSLVTTPAMPPLDGALGAFFAALTPGTARLLDLHRDAAGAPALGYAVPVYRVQGGGQPSEQVGWILGLRPVARALWPLLAQPGETGKSAENILVRHHPPLVEYLSPLADGSGPLARSFADNTPGLAAARAVARPGAFIEGSDYREHEVIAVSRPVAGLPWLLISKIDRAEALGVTEQRLDRLLIIGLLTIAFGFALLVAVWRHGASRRATAAARRHAEMARRFDARGRLLRLVTDSQPNAIYMADAEGRVAFANEEAARRTGISAADMVGKGLAALFGTAAARPRLALSRQALEDGVKLAQTLQEDGGRVIQAVHVPLPADGGEAAVLVVENDVTEAVTERARRERTLDRLVATLMAVVDKRDPYAGHQSERTSRLARAIAEEMRLDPVTVQTAEIAGRVMSLGKILVPAEVLARSGELTAEEIRNVRDSLQATADLISGIEFDGPVVETLRQLQERWDGAGGPQGIEGERILLPARIVAVANAFVAMVSARAWRTGSSVDDAFARLMAEVGAAFDRRVVVALGHYLDNRGGRAQWEALDGEAAAS